MNKIYRLIWNSALNTWVVASEAAKAHGKNGSRSRMAKLVMASTLLLPALAPDSVLAQWNNAGSSATGSGAVAAGGGTTGTAASATTSESVAIGDGATATSRKSGSDTGVGATAIGHGAQATTTYGGGPVAIGTSAKAIVSAGNGGSPVAIGTSSDASGNGSQVAIGDQAKANGTDAIAIGGHAGSAGSLATGNSSTAIGQAASATGTGSVALGYLVKSSGQGSVAIGGDGTVGSTASGTGAFAVGSGASALADSTIALSAGSSATATGAIAIGSNANASAANSMAIGLGAGAQGGDAVAAGHGANASTSQTVALGAASTAQGGSFGPIAIGYGATAAQVNMTGAFAASIQKGHIPGAAEFLPSTTYVAPTVTGNSDASTAVGYQAIASGGYSTALGHWAMALQMGATALGEGTRANGVGAAAVGDDTVADADHALAVGYNTAALDQNATAVGFKSLASVNSATALGSSSTASAQSAVALGDTALASGTQTIAIGNNAKATGKQSLSIGTGNVVSGNNSGAIGDPTTITGSGSYSLGNNNTIANNNSFVIGSGVTTTQDNSVVLGNASTDRPATTVTGTTIAGTNYTFAGNGSPANGVVSVGAVGAERQIINVAPGQISAKSTDAINGSQLYATNQAIAAAQTHYYSVNDTGTPTGNYNNDGATGIGSLAAGTNATASGDHSTAVGNGAKASAASAIAIGNGAVADGASLVDSPIAIGTNAHANNTGATAVGLGSTAGFNDSAFGQNSNATGNSSVALGNRASATGYMSTAVGPYSSASSEGAVAVGNGSSGAYYGTAVGAGANAGMNSSAIGDGSMANGVSAALGHGASASGGYSSALGPQTTASGSGSLAAGVLANASNSDAAALGSGSTASGEQSIAAGHNANASAYQSAAFGAGASATAANSVALGASSTTTADLTQPAYNPGTATIAGTSPVGEVSVGSAGAERRITNLAAGSADTDAVNVSQLKAASTHYYSVNDGGTVGGNYNNNGATGIDALAAGVDSTATGLYSTAIGRASTATGQSSVAVGDTAGANSPAAIAIGLNSQANAGSSTAIGNNATVNSTFGIAMGYHAKADDDGSPSSEGATAIGDLAYSKGAGATALGYNASASVGGTTAVGTQSTASGSFSSAFGAGAKTSDEYATALGSGASASGTGSIAAGTNASASGYGALAMGYASNASGVISTAVGPQANASGDYAVALGYLAQGVGGNGVALGSSSTASGLSSVALGAGSQATADNSVALGANSTTTADLTKPGYNPSSTAAIAGTSPVGEVSVGVGGSERRITNLAAGSADTDAVNVSQLKAASTHYYSVNDGGVASGNYNNDGASGTNALAAGVNAVAGSSNSVAMGNGAQAKSIDARDKADNAIAIGNQAISNATGGVSLGSGATVGVLATNSVAIGTGAWVNTNANNAVAIGGGAQTVAPDAAAIGANSIAYAQSVALGSGANGGSTVGTGDVAVGYNASTPSNHGTAIGWKAVAGGDWTQALATAVGSSAEALKQGSTALGESATASAMNATALGWDSNATAAGGVAIGSNSVANTGSGVAGFVPAGVGSTQSAAIAATTGTQGAVSVGNASSGVFRQINGVAAGTVDSDAVNVAQLKAVDSKASAGWNLQANGGTASNVAPGGTVNVVNGNNINVTQNGNQLTIATADDVSFNSVTTGNTKLDTNGLTITGGPSFTATNIDAAGQQIHGVAAGTASTDAVNVSQLTQQGTDLTAKGLSFAGNSGTVHTNLGDTLVIAGAAATVGTYSGNNLKTVADPTTGAVNLQMADNPEFTSVKTGNTTIDNSGLTINGGPSITTAGIDAGNTKIVNVAPGDVSATSTDAVNGSQLNATNQNVTNLGDTVNNFAGDQSTTNTTVNGRGIRYVRTNDAGLPVSDAFAQGQGSTAVGYEAKSTGADALALGRNAQASADNSVALGANSTTTADLTTPAYNPGTGTIAGTAPVGEVSVGSAGAERRITNLAAGAADTDAVNVSQLKSATAASVADAVMYDNSTHNSVTLGGDTYNTTTKTGGTVIHNVAAGTSGGDAVNVDQLNQQGSDLTAKGLNFAGNSGAAVHTNLGDTLTIAGTATTAGTYSGNNLKTVTDPATGAVNLQMADNPEFTSVKTGNTTINDSGLTIAGGPSFTATNIDAAGQQIHGVAAGTASTDAVNVSQLTQQGSDLTAKGLNFAGNSGTVHTNLGDTLVIAGAAATVGTYSGNNLKTVADPTTGAVNLQMADNPEFTSVKTGNTTIDNSGLTINGGPSITTAGIDAGNTKIVNVAPGDVSATSTDAVNGSQLYQTNQTVTNLGDTVNNFAGDQSTSNTTVNGRGIRYVRTNDTGLPVSDAFAQGQGSTAVGYEAKSTGADALALGRNAQASADNSVALGANSTTTADLTTPAYNPGTGTIAGTSPVGEVSVGSAGAERRITNLAAGAADTDAVNVSQLKSATAASVADAVMYDNSTHNSVTLGGDTYNTTTKQGGTVIHNVAAGTSGGDAVNVDQLNQQGSDLTAKGLNFAGNSGTAVHTNLGDTLTIAGAATTAGTYSGNNLKTVTDPTTGAVNLQMADNPEFTSVKTGNTTIDNSGLTIAGGPSITTAGIDAGNTKIVNVAPGDVSATSTDAVNGSQLYQTNQTVTNLGDTVNNFAGDQSTSNTTVNGRGIRYVRTNDTGLPVSDAFAQGQGSTAVGYEAKSTGADALALGRNAQASADNSVALGANSTTTSDLTTPAYNPGTGTIAGTSPVGEVSVGSAGAERRITNLAAGAADTDAVNVSQLKAVDGKVSNLDDRAVKYDVDPTTGAVNYNSVTLGGDTYNTTTKQGGTVIHNVAAGTSGGDAVNVDQLNQQGSDLTAKGLNFAGNSGTAVHTNLGDTLTIAGAATTVGTYSGNNLKTVTDPATGAVNLQMADNPEFTSVKTGNTTINDSGLTINGGPSITTAGIDAGGKVISNVAPGVAGTDAVNVDQLTAVDTKVDNVTNTVNNFAGDQSTTNTTINGRGIRYVRTNDTGLPVSDAFAQGQGSTAVGYEAKSTGADALALGRNAQASADNSVALGANSTTTADLTTPAYNPGTGTIAGTSPVGEVSVGSAGAERRITNLAAGAADTDAVNVSQLKSATAASVADAVMYDNSTHNSVTLGGDTYNTTTKQGGTVIHNVAAGTSGGDAVNVDQLNQQGSDLTAKGLNFAGNSGTAVHTNLGDTLTIAGTATTAGTYSGNNLKTVTDPATGAVQLQMADAPKFGNVTINDGGSGKITGVTAGTAATDAVNVSQLTQVADSSVKYDKNTDGTTNYNSVTLGGDTYNSTTKTGGTVIHNVAAGTSGGDAVNVDQLNTTVDASKTHYYSVNDNGVQGGNYANDGATGVNSLAAGVGAKATADGGVALGSGSVASTAAGVAGFVPQSASTAQGAAIAATTSTLGAVSVGDATNGQFRQITGVAAGTADSDAVNVAQLKGVDQKVDTLDNNAVKYDKNTDGTVNYNSVTLGGDTYNTTTKQGGTVIHNVAAGTSGGDAVNVDQLNQQGSDLTAKGLNFAGNSGTAVHTNLGDTLTIAGTATTAGTYSGNNLKTVTDPATGAVQLQMADAPKFGNVTINDGGSGKITGVTAGTAATDAVNVSQLTQVADSSVKYDKNTDGTTNYNSVTLGGDTYNSTTKTGGTVIHNVAAGTSGGDAVNVDQLNTTVDASKTHYYSVNDGGVQGANYANDGATGLNAMAMGVGASASTAGGVALGSGSVASTAGGIAGWVPTGADTALANAVMGTMGTAGAVSVGNPAAGIYRQITGVAAGTASSDAVNVAQLQAAISSVDGKITPDDGRNVKYDGTGNAPKDHVTLAGTTSTDGGQTGGTTISNLHQGDVSANSTDAVNGAQLYQTNTRVTNLEDTVNNWGDTINKTEANTRYFQADGTNTDTDKAYVKAGTKGVASGANASVTGNNGVAMGNTASASGNNSTAIGANSTATHDNSVALGAGSTTDRANSVSVGSAGNERQITNVAAGTAATDAVNVSQLQSGLSDVQNAAINYTNQQVTNVRRDAYAGTASAMAMAALPQATLPGRGMVAMGGGTYGGQSAIALGLSQMSESGRWVFKAQATSNTRGNVGVAAGAGFHW